MENQLKKPWVLGKFGKIIGLVWVLFCFAGLIGRFVIGGKEFFRNEYMMTVHNILLGLLLLISSFDIINSLIYDKEAALKKLKDFFTRKRILDLLIPVIFGMLLMTIYFYSRKN